MAFNSTETLSSVYRWIERKPLSEAVSWTSREKFWLVTAVCHYGIHEWKSVVQILKNAGEPYRPREWYTPKSCERQFKVVISNLSKEFQLKLQLKPLNEVLELIAEDLKKEYVKEAATTEAALRTNYDGLFTILNRVKQGNLSRNEVVKLYSIARRNEIESKQYVEQLMTRQVDLLASENPRSGLSEEPIKWNTPSAPLLTSLLRSRNTIPANRTATTIASLLQPACGTSRTRSGKLLSLSPNVRTTTQGTPTLSKLLEAPANPYIPSPQQASQKNKPSDIVGTEKLVGSTSRKENSQSTSLNRVRVDNISTTGSINQTNKIDLSASKRQTPRSPVSAVKNGSKGNPNVVNLLSDSDNEESNNSQIILSSFHPKNLFEEKKDNNITASNSNRIETRATRSQTRAEGGFKHLNDTKLSGGKKERDTLRQHSATEPQITETHSIEDELIDIDQIEIEPLSSVQDDTINHTPSKITRSSVQRLRLNSPAENVLPNKMKNKEINNQMLEEISANFVLNSTSKNVATEYKNVMVAQSRIENPGLAQCFGKIDTSAVKDSIILRKDGQSFPHPANTLTTFDGKVLKQKRLIEIKGTNLRCIDGRNDTKYLSISNPIVVVNKMKKALNIKVGSSEVKDKTDSQVKTNNETKKTGQLYNSSQNFGQLLDGNCSLTDEIIIIDDDDDDDTTKNKELPSKSESHILPSTVSGTNDSGSNLSSNSKSIGFQLNSKTTKTEKIPCNMVGKNLDITSKKLRNLDAATKIGIKSSIKEPNSRFIKELDFDFDQSISQTSLSELYNGVEEIVEMHSFDNEELNSLIECGSLDSSETEERQNTTNLDHGDSSVSESDSTIGAFDTFAQITRVTQKTSSKEVKSINKDSKTIKQVGNDVESDEGIVQSDEVDDDQSTAASVTGIPILQGVISDVMSKINSDRVAALKVVDPLNESTDEIVEISSDEEELLHMQKQLPSTLTEKEKPRKEKVIHKLNADEKKKTKVRETNSILVNKTKSISKEIKETSVNSSDIKNIKCHNLNATKKPAAKNVTELESILFVKELESKGSKRKHIELKNDINIRDVSKSSEAIINEKAFKEAETKALKLLELKKAEERLKFEKELKIKKAAEEKRLKEMLHKQIEEEKKMKEEEERKKKEDERRKKEDERRKKEDELRKEEERKKKEEERKIKEEEERKIKEEEERKIKEEEERKIKEEEERKIKEEEERKIKEEEERKIKEEEERKIKEEERKIKEEERKIKEEEERKIKEEEERKIKEEEERIKKKEEAEKIKLTALQIKQEKFDELEEDLLQRAAESERMVLFEEQIQNNIKNKIIKDEFEVERMKMAKKNELKKARIAELIKARDNEIKKLKAQELEIIKLKELELLTKAREVEVLRAKERARQKDFNKIREMEVQRVINKEMEKERQEARVAEIQRAKVAAMKKKKESEMLKKKEAEILRAKIEENHKKQEAIIRRKKREKMEEKQLQDDKKLNLTKEPSLTLVEQSLKKTKKSDRPMLDKNAEIIASKVKENITKPSVNKMLTRTRGLKSKEKIKKHNSDIKNANDEELTSLHLDDPDDIVLFSKARLNSILKALETSQLKQDDTAPKVSEGGTAGTKKILTGTYCEIPTTSEDFHKYTAGLGSYFEPPFRSLSVPLVKLDDYSLPLSKVKLDAMRKSSNKVVVNEPLPTKPVNVNEIVEKPPPKKRGRKRRNNVQNEPSNSKKSRFENGARTNNTVALSLTKRTRSSADLIREREEETLAITSVTNKLLKKNVLRLVINNIYESNMYLPPTEKQVKDLSFDGHSVVKQPVDVKYIRKQIGEGSIQSISDIQIKLMILSYNAIMINKIKTIVFSDASDFQEKLLSDVDCFRCALATDEDLLSEKKNDDNNINYTDDNEEYCIDPNIKLTDGDRLIIENCDDDDSNDTECDDTVNDIYKSIEFSSNDSCSDSESDNLLPLKKRRKTAHSYANTSDSNIDSDDYGCSDD